MTMPDWRSMIVAGDAELLAVHAGRELGLMLPPGPFMAECQQAMLTSETRGDGKLGGSSMSGELWSDGTWIAWLKQRAVTLGAYQIVHADAREIRWASCTLHVGFVCVEETEEHLHNLRKHKEKAAAARVARSKISATNDANIRPVDGVAAKVVFVK